VPKWLEIDQDNLQMKFSALIVDFGNPSPDSLGLRRFVHAGVQEGYPSKKWLFFRYCLSSMKMVAGRHRHAG